MRRILRIIMALLCVLACAADSGARSHARASTRRNTSAAEAIDLSAYPSTITIHGDTLQDSTNLHWGMASPIGTVLDKHYFVIDYNDHWKEPYWVAYHLSEADLSGTAHRQNNFRPDNQLPIQYRSELADYQKSGYDRGHSAPAADFTRSSEAMSETFLLSNMSPQSPYLNRRIWAKLEGQVRFELGQFADAWIVTGNIFMSADSQPAKPSLTIGPDSVAVPDYCFKVILLHSRNGSYRLFAFLIPNLSTPIPGMPSDYIVSVRRLERIADYTFFPNLPDSIRDTMETELPKGWVSR